MFPGADVIANLVWIFTIILIVRAFLSWAPDLRYTQVGRIVVAATEWYLAPIRRVIPPAGGLDLSFIVGFIILLALQTILRSGSIVSAVVTVVSYVLFLIIILLLARIFLSFFRLDPWHPITQMLIGVTEPFAQPFRGFFPRKYNQFDWAPVAAFVVVLVVYLVVQQLARFGIG
jgi:YggT family protein